MFTIDIAEVKRRHDGHWFDRDTLRFFSSRIARIAYCSDAGDVAFFVSSEQPPNGTRAYSVRRCDMTTGKIDTVGQFCSMTASQARDRAKQEATLLDFKVEQRGGPNGTTDHRLVDDRRKIRTPWLAEWNPQVRRSASTALRRAEERYMQSKITRDADWRVVHAL